MRYHIHIVNGLTAAMEAIEVLVYRSQWFEFTPLPDGQYEIKVKIENAHLLK